METLRRTKRSDSQEEPKGQRISLPVIDHLQERVQRLEERVTVLEQKRSPVQQEEVVELRTVSRQEAKEEIRALLATGETFYMSEIAERLNLPDDLVVELCQELRQEGELQVNANVL